MQQISATCRKCKKNIKPPVLPQQLRGYLLKDMKWKTVDAKASMTYTGRTGVSTFLTGICDHCDE